MSTSTYLITWLRHGLTFRARVREWGPPEHAMSRVLMPGDALLAIQVLEP